jgi:ribonuclease HI
MELNPSKGILCYTDGSFSTKEGPGGWAWVAVDGFGAVVEGSGFVPPPTTNNRMEMQSQVEALQSLYDEYGSCEIEIVSDSSYVVLGCQFPSRARNVNQDLWDALDEAVLLHNWVQWRHVRGHIGVKYNEQADKLAVKARKEARWK